MINYTIAEFLGIFLIGLPGFIYLSVLLFRGLFWITEIFFDEKDGDDKNFFHHHFHYKDRKK